MERKRELFSSLFFSFFCVFVTILLYKEVGADFMSSHSSKPVFLPTFSFRALHGFSFEPFLVFFFFFFIFGHVFFF